MIQKIKVTKQEIRTYEGNGRIISYNFNQDFLDSLLGRDGKFEMISRDKNVKWYERKGIKLSESESLNFSFQDDLKPEPGSVEVLKREGFEFTEKAEEVANNYPAEILREYSKNNRITAHTIKAIESEIQK